MDLKEDQEKKLMDMLARLGNSEKKDKANKFGDFFRELKSLPVTLIMSKKRKTLVDYIIYNEKEIKPIWFNQDIYVDLGNGSREYGKSFITRLKKININTAKTKEECVD